MTIQILKSLLADKSLEINGTYYRFEHGGKLILISNGVTTSNNYQIVSRNNEFYLQTDNPIIGDKKEALTSLLIGDCDNGIAISKWD